MAIEINDEIRAYVFNLSSAIGREFDNKDLASDADLRAYAEWFISLPRWATPGTDRNTAFLTSLHSYRARLSVPQLRAGLNVAMDLKRMQDARRATPVIVPAESAQPAVILAEPTPERVTMAQVATGLVVPDGIYTVVLDPGTGEYRTLRLMHPKPDVDGKVFGDGAQVAKFLSGSDNEHSYTGFAFVNGSEARVWKSFARNSGDSAIMRALTVLLTDGQSDAYGRAYAMQSGNCFRCNRTLTTPESLARGLGPICADASA